MEKLIPQDIFRRIEGELFRYQTFVKEYHEKREELLHSTPRPDTEGRSIGHVSDPTLARAMKLAALDESEAAKWAKIITYAIGKMPSGYQRLIRVRYFDGEKNPDKLAEILEIDRRTVFRWRMDIVLRIYIDLLKARIV